jgi:3-phenylpropionate/trans-cinnamate dioxygenase ferredoxin reductase subunit
MTQKGIVIAGGGLTAQRAAETLRRTGYDGSLRMIIAELELPYDRPRLTKDFLGGELEERMLRFRANGWYAGHAIGVLLGDPAATLDGRAGRRPGVRTPRPLRPAADRHRRPGDRRRRLYRPGGRLDGAAPRCLGITVTDASTGEPVYP